MRLPSYQQSSAREHHQSRRGAVLMLSLLVLFVLLLIVFQISISTSTHARAGRNEETVKIMDLALESALLQVWEDLAADGEADAAAGGGDGADPMAAMGGGGDESSGPSDSKEDEWARPQRTEINGVQLRIFIQDEDSKFNLLSILTADPDEADKAFDRLVRVIENSRKGTDAEIDSTTAYRMANRIREYMRKRDNQDLPRADLLTDEDSGDLEGIGLMLSLRELVAVDSDLFELDLFRDFRDKRGDVVHSLGSFLTVWTSLVTADEAGVETSDGGGGGLPAGGSGAEAGGASGGGSVGAQGTSGGATTAGSSDGTTSGPSGPTLPSSGGPSLPSGSPTGTGADGGEAAVAEGRINVNTAPLAVLVALLDSRDLPYGLWEDVLLYRNTEEEDEEADPDSEPPLDEFGDEIIAHQFFDNLEELAEVDSWNSLEPYFQSELNQLLTTQSQVFSIFITARKSMGEENTDMVMGSREAIEEEEHEGRGVVRTIRSVIWRRALGDGTVEIVPLIRWEELDYVPYEVLDYAEDEEPH